MMDKWASGRAGTRRIPESHEGLAGTLALGMWETELDPIGKKNLGRKGQKGRHPGPSCGAPAL